VVDELWDSLVTSVIAAAAGLWCLLRHPWLLGAVLGRGRALGCRLHQRIRRARRCADRLRLLVHITEEVVVVVHACHTVRCCESPVDTATLFGAKRRRFLLRSGI